MFFTICFVIKLCCFKHFYGISSNELSNVTSNLPLSWRLLSSENDFHASTVEVHYFILSGETKNSFEITGSKWLKGKIHDKCFWVWNNGDLKITKFSQLWSFWMMACRELPSSIFFRIKDTEIFNIIFLAVEILLSFQTKSCVKSMICMEKKAWRMITLVEGIIKAGLILMKNLVSFKYHKFWWNYFQLS